MPDFFYYLTTTDGSDKKLIASVMKEFDCSKMAAIKKIVNNREKKSA
jgi:hypothetical protein